MARHEKDIAPEQFFLETLFAQLNEADIRYAVLRNYTTLPYSTGGSDLDILVHPDDTEQAKKIVFDAIKKAGGTSMGIVQTWTFFEVYAYGVKQGVWWGLCVELYTGVQFKSSVPLVSSKEFNACISKYRGISVVPEHLGNTIGFIKEVLAHDTFRTDKPQYQKSALKLYNESNNQYNSIFAPLGSKGLALLPKLLQSQTNNEMAAEIRKFRRVVLSTAFFRSPLSFLYKRVVHEFHRVKRYFDPSGTIIVILGVDGVGKSTVINAIKPILNAATHNAVFVQHLRPGLLPPLARLKGQQTIQIGPVLDPHGSTPSGVFGSLLRLTWLMLDYFFGYWLKTRFVIAKRPAIVMFDRYAYDMALDPRRFRIGLPGWVAGWFSRLAPKPDLILCLHAEPEVIAARKQELPLEETRRQVEALRAFARKEPRSVLITTDGSIEEVRERVLETLYEFFSQRANNER